MCAKPGLLISSRVSNAVLCSCTFSTPAPYPTNPIEYCPFPPLCVTGAVPVDAKAAELKFWTKNDGQVRIRFHFRQGTVYMNSSPSVGDCLS